MFGHGVASCGFVKMQGANLASVVRYSHSRLVTAAFSVVRKRIFLPPFWSPVICFRSLSAFVLMPQVAASTTLAVRPLGRMERGPHVRGAAVRALMTTRRRPFMHQQSPPRSELEAFRGSSGDAKPHTWQTSHLTLLPARAVTSTSVEWHSWQRSGSGGNLSVFWFNRFRRAGEIRQCGDFEPSSSLMPPCAA